MTLRIFSVLIVIASTNATIAAEPDFRKDVLPILRSHCVKCHGPKKQESRIRLDNLSTDLINNRAAAESWHEVLNVLNGGEMPPEGESVLSAEQRKTLTTWVSAAIQKAVEARRKTDGRVVIRRLNRVEYQNTMTDLLGLEMDYARDLPPDAVSSDGFRNDGRSLRMSALQLEYYLETARRALDRIIVVGDPPKKYDYEFDKSNVKKWLGKVEYSNRLGRKQQFLAKMAKDYPESGSVLVRVKLTADIKPDSGYPLLETSIGYRPDTQILFRSFDLVEITSTKEQTLEFRGRLEDFPLPVRGQGKYPGLVVRLRNVYEGSQEPALQIQAVEFHAPAYDQWPPALHRRLLFDSPLREKDEDAYVAEVLKRFMTRAFRRPVTDGEVQKMADFHKSIRLEFPTFEETMRETLAMVLIQPDFLYLLEAAPKPIGDKDEKRTIDNWELAARLSYFLWNTMPDDRLMDLAKQGKLKKPKTLASEVDRMLKDSRSRRFAEQFTEQWLHLNVVDSVAISRDYYPKFNDRLKEDMRGETQQFFAELVRHNLSALNLLSSDFTMLNGPLAQHYGINGIHGRGFQRVALKPEQHRGGLLGQASVLLSNSTGSDSHAVRRAVWIRDRLLNDPPAPPPPDVPSLDEADPKFHKLSIREQLEIHRKREACASCHRNIDPWGIALENFDAVGLWREDVRRKKKGKKFDTLPVNAKDTLPNGRELDGVDSLRDYLVKDRKDEFARALVSRLLTYALGRRLELSDKQAIDKITKSFIADGYRVRGLIQKIVASEPFQTK